MYIHFVLRGASKKDAEITPFNLIWIMPAEEKIDFCLSPFF